MPPPLLGPCGGVAACSADWNGVHDRATAEQRSVSTHRRPGLHEKQHGRDPDRPGVEAQTLGNTGSELDAARENPSLILSKCRVKH